MKAISRTTGFSVVIFALTALVLGGCSSGNRVTAPATDGYPDINKGQGESTSLSQTGNILAKSSGDDNNSDRLFTIEAEAHRIDIEGGCFYLKATDGNIYTPVTPKDLTLKEGLKLKAKGYVDRDVFLFCGNGPAFVIQKFEVIGGKGDSDRDRNSDGLAANDYASEDSDLTKVSEDRYRNELTDMQLEILKRKKLKGDMVPKAPSEERNPKISEGDDNERFEDAEDRYVDYGNMNNAERREEKRTIEEERYPRDPSDPNDQKPENLFDPGTLENSQHF